MYFDTWLEPIEAPNGMEQVLALGTWLPGRQVTTEVRVKKSRLMMGATSTVNILKPMCHVKKGPRAPCPVPQVHQTRFLEDILGNMQVPRQ